MSTHTDVRINQSVAILIDGNNIERGLQKLAKDDNALLDFDKMVPKLLQGRGLKRLIYFREGISISDKLAERLLTNYHGSVVPCHKSADIPLTIMATQIAPKVDTIIILSGDSDYVELVRHLKGEGVRVEIAAVQHATAKILVDEVEHFTPITMEDCYILKVAGRSSSKRPSTTKRPSTAKKTADKPTPEKGKEKPKRSTKKTESKAKTESAKEEKPKRKPRRTASPKSTSKPTTIKDTKPSTKRTSAKRKPAAKSIKELAQDSKRSSKPVVQKTEDWDDLSF